jgi:hypothetical protein
MTAIEHMTYRRSPGSNPWAFDEARRDARRAPLTSGPSTDFSSDDSIPLFLSDPRGEPDPREFAPLITHHRTSLARVLTGRLVISAFAMLVAVAVFNPDVSRVLIDRARASMGGATEDQSAMQSASNQPAVHQIQQKDPPLGSDPVTVGSVSASSPPTETPSREPIVSVSQTAPQSQVPAKRTANEAATPSKTNEAAAPPKTLDAETLAALTVRARNLLARGDIAAARLLLERAANAQDATAAFLLAQTYDPAVLGVRDARSTAPDPAMARDWYRTAAGLGSTDAQKRLTQLQN